MWMTEFQGPAQKNLEPHLTMMLNIQTQWAVPAEETKIDKQTQSLLTLQNLSSEHSEDPTPSHSRLPSQIIGQLRYFLEVWIHTMISERVYVLNKGR